MGKNNPAGSTEGAEGKKVKVRALVSLFGTYLLPYDNGDEFEIHEGKAAEMVANKDAEYLNPANMKVVDAENASDKAAAGADKATDKTAGKAQTATDKGAANAEKR